jgi:hypothetical protein
MISCLRTRTHFHVGTVKEEICAKHFCHFLRKKDRKKERKKERKREGKTLESK